eukprot:CAMPEP_0197035060 /NCGR_PEP_ID=MMETSP1384-20130603/12951_1 /TAXON_ID=29189 /ORGANISM="Ammonia sp." /LENGTH=1073 /DNA_ID=CAMNT_0042465065 /DNA_START=20 /DNA_END=3241 /DNA_ORIENTATION=-
MDDFGFGPDPQDAIDLDVAQYEEDRAVLDDIERDLGKSYIADRVTPAKNHAFNPFRGQTYTANSENDQKNNHEHPQQADGALLDEDEEKEIEFMENYSLKSNMNKPLVKSTRKRKRSVEHREDVMDLSDLPNAKRMKTNVNRTQSVALRDTHNATEHEQQANDIQVIDDEHEIYLHDQPSLNDTYFAVTNDTDGEKKYIYYDSYGQYQRRMRQSVQESQLNIVCKDTLGLLQGHKSIDQLLDEIENERISDRIRELNANFLDLKHNDRNIPKYMQHHDEVQETALWVDKYSPKGMTDLLSSEKINREVTEWVKQWDFLVFGHRYSRLQHANNNKFVRQNNHSKANQNVNKSKHKNVYSIRNNLPKFGNNTHRKIVTYQQQPTTNDKKKRPEVSVLLFCGAPGTGKSTLAHIVANHCGYRPFEINASDDRSGKKLKDVIINAATMKPMFGDTRPPLIIMDEIDGAQNSNGDSKSAVDVIINIVKEAEAYHRQKEKQGDSQRGKAATKKRKNQKIVNRPIICICNNEYSRALRPLREICRIYKFKPISTGVLCKRLQDICRKEYLHTDLKTLSYLAEITNNDIRSCLHTLQFFKEKSGGGRRLSTRLNVDTLQNTPIGRKDKTQNIFDVWNRILKKKKVKKRHAYYTQQKQTKKQSENTEWTEICSMIYGMNDDAKIMNGVIENYLSLGYSDPLFEVTLNTSQCIARYDILNHLRGSKQMFVLMPYMAYTLIAIHEHCATDTFQKLQYPSTQYKHDMLRKQNKNIIQQFLHCEADHHQQNDKKQDNDQLQQIDSSKYACILSRYFNLNSSVLELVPLLPFIIFTSHQWNNSDFTANGNDSNYYHNNNRQKYGDGVSHKRTFVSIINTMIECGLNYVRSLGGSWSASTSSSYLQLSPPIDKLSRYSFRSEEYKKLAQYGYMSQYVKEKIAHQIVLEIMRRNEAGSNKYKQMEQTRNLQHNEGGEDNDEEQDQAEENGSQQAFRTMTPFMSGKPKQKSASRLSKKDALMTPCGNGQFGASKPPQSASLTPAKKHATNFILAHNRKSKIHKYEYPILYKFVEGYTNAVRRKSFVRDWI